METVYLHCVTNYPSSLKRWAQNIQNMLISWNIDVVPMLPTQKASSIVAIDGIQWPIEVHVR